tara:strand:+ start:331 stop:498 length:168 start_codon:yes stop_codon:yes gene_type:complete
MKYYIVHSNKNPRGIWCSDEDLSEVKENYFSKSDGHKKVGQTEITEEHYYHLIHG